MGAVATAAKEEAEEEEEEEEEVVVEYCAVGVAFEQYSSRDPDTEGRPASASMRHRSSLYSGDTNGLHLQSCTTSTIKKANNLKHEENRTVMHQKSHSP